MKYSSAIDQTEMLLQSSLLCSLEPNGPPAHRIQLFFAGYKHLNSDSHEMALQKTIENGANIKKYWVHNPYKGKGQYSLTSLGYQKAISLFGNVGRIYLPAEKRLCACSFKGTFAGKEIHFGYSAGRSFVTINHTPFTVTGAVERISHMGKYFDSSESVKYLYDFCVDNNFQASWDEPALIRESASKVAASDK